MTKNAVSRFVLMAAIVTSSNAWMGLQPARAQTPDIWFVWANGSQKPWTIGVADVNYNEPNWGKISVQYGSDSEAWLAACVLHSMPEYHSPDIAAGRIVCARLVLTGSPPAALTTPVSTASWDGVWDAGWGPLDFTVRGNEIRGRYASGRHCLDLTITGNEATGRWRHPENNRSGDVGFEMDDDGNLVRGWYSEGGGRPVGWAVNSKWPSNKGRPNYSMANPC